MKLVSPRFLQTCQSKKAKILKYLFEDDDIFAVIMEQKKFTFLEACEWIADYVFETELPLANDSEIKMMQLAAKEMVKELKEKK